MLICLDQQQVANTDKSKRSLNFKFLCYFGSSSFLGPRNWWRNIFISDWREIGQTLLDLSWRRDDIRPVCSEALFSKPDAIANLQGKFCKHTQDFWYFEDQSRKPTCF